MGALMDRWLARATDFLPTLLTIALILVVTIVLARRTQSLVRRISARTQAPAEIVDLFGRAVRVTILSAGVLFVLDQLNLSRAVLSFIAGLGIAGIVIGFALQDIVKQFAAGVLLLMLRPFRIGDEVKIGAFEGRVAEVQLRATVLKTSGGDEVLIPNADVYTTAIVNRSRQILRRHEVAVTLPAESDLPRAHAAMAEALAGVPGVAASPAPAIVALGLDGQTVKLEARFWVDERADSADGVRTSVVAAMRGAIEQAAGDTATR